MKVTDQQYASALYQVLQEVKPADHDRVIENFAEALRNNGDLLRFEKIVSAYEALDRQERNVAQAKLTFARETEVSAGLLKQLNELTNKHVEVESKIDPGIIGGVVIRIDDTLVDASIKGQLDRLKRALSN